MSTRVRGEMERWNVWLPTKTLQRLEAAADRTGMPMSEHARRALNAYLEAMEKACALDPATPPP